MRIRHELIGKVVERLRALADETRIRLLVQLKEQPANVTSLANALRIAQPSVSKHLAILKQAGIVDAERSGAQTIYRVRDQSIFDLCQIVCDGVVRFVEAEHAALNLGLTSDVRSELS